MKALRKLQLIRLSSALLLSAGACFFVQTWSRTAAITYGLEMPGAVLMNGCEWLVRYASLAWFVPLGTLAGAALAQRARAPFALEIVIALTGLFAFGWTGACLLLWHLQRMPVVHLNFRSVP